jgi:dTDP-4-dehydrorhamnose 3,5-epimerase
VRASSTDLPEVVLIEPDVYKDNRGFFLETYHAGKYREIGIGQPFVQDNHSRSVQGTVRGLHLQVRRPQAKLIRVVVGEIFDVAVDVRRGSPNFGRWVGVTLSAASFAQLYVPAGFAHGFGVLSPVAEIEYKCTDLYDPADEVGIAWNDPDLAIAWRLDAPTLSERDRRNPPLAALMERLPTYPTTES